MVKFVEARLMRDVKEDYGSAVGEATGGDWAGVGIFDGSVDAASGHAGGAWQRILRLVGSGLRGLPTKGNPREFDNAE